MGYSSLVKGNVRKAFSLIKDLAITVTLYQKNTTGFNFSDSTVESTNNTPKQIKGVFITKKSGKNDKEVSTSLTTQFLFNAEDLIDPGVYDKIVMQDGTTWTILQPFLSDGYIVTLDVTRSV